MAHLLLAALALCCGSGCFHSWINSWLNPSEVGSFDTTHTSEIRQSISVLEEPGGLALASDPTPEDLIPYAEEYRIALSDVLIIKLFELLVPGADTVIQPVVDERGSIYVPELGWMDVAGLTARELQALLIDELRKLDILKDARVEVSIPGRRGRVYHIFGVIARPGSYPIPKPGFRLLEALVMAGGLLDAADQIYVIRPSETEPLAAPGTPEPQSPQTAPISPAKPGSPEDPPPTGREYEADGEYDYEFSETLLSAYSGGGAAADSGAWGGVEPLGDDPIPPEPGSEPTTRPSEPSDEALDTDLLEAISPTREPPGAAQPLQEEAAAAETQPEVERDVPATQEVETQPAPLSHWIWLNGKWIEVVTQPGAAGPETVPTLPPATRPETQRVVGWEDMEVPPTNRIIAIPANLLRDGDARFNVVIRDQDAIRVTAGETGQYYMMGHVMRPGVYSLVGLKVTLKQAIAAAGGLDPLAWPDRCDLIRRIGPDRETVIPIDLDRIFAGQTPDFFLKPNDIVHVGTHAVAPFLFAIRSAFRLTYGFGFVWDRNFGDIESQGGSPNPRILRRQQQAQRLPGLFP